MDIRIFGTIDTQNPDEYYEDSIVLFDKEVEIDLNILEEEEVDEARFNLVNDFLKSIESYAQKAFDAISADYDLGEESETARFYLTHHLEEFSEDEQKEVFGSTDVDKATYMQALRLYRIGLYPEDDESFAIFDIQLPRDYTNYLMAVTFDDAGELSYISMDS